MNKGRLHYSILNSSITIVAQAVNLILKFVLQTVFILTLGASYLGVNGLFTNVLTILSFAELGIGTAITFSLYKPLENGDYQSVNMIMAFFKKAYRLIAVFVAIIGVILIPFLPYLVKGHIDNLYDIYLLFLTNSVISYFFSYKRSLLIADQKTYINVINQLEFTVIQVVVQIFVLFTLKNFLIFLTVQIGCTILSNILISIKVNHYYPQLNDKVNESIPIDTYKEIKKNTIGMMGSRIGGIAVTGTDNLVISAFIGVYYVGIYSNYFLIVNSIANILTQATNSVAASVGNLIISGSNDSQYKVFKKHFFINYLVTILCSSLLIGLLNPFIVIWIGEKYTFDNLTVLFIVVSFMVNQLRQTPITFISAYGLFYKIGTKSIIEAILNLTTTIFFVTILNSGIRGVFIGTILSNLLINTWYEPFIVSKYGLKGKFGKEILLTYLMYIFSCLCSIILIQQITLRLELSSIMSIIMFAFIALVLLIALLSLVFGRTEEYKFLKNIILSRIHLKK